MDATSLHFHQLRSQLDCAVCYERIADRLLACGHSFCLTCLSRLPTHQSAITCPACRTRTPLAHADTAALKSLPLNFTALQMHDAVLSKLQWCPRHYDDHWPLDRWCMQCGMGVCAQCTNEQHARHRCLPVPAAAQEQQRRLLALSDASRTLVLDAQAWSDRWHQCRVDLMGQIDDEYAQLMAQLQQRRDALRSKVESSLAEERKCAEETISEQCFLLCNDLIRQGTIRYLF